MADVCVSTRTYSALHLINTQNTTSNWELLGFSQIRGETSVHDRVHHCKKTKQKKPQQNLRLTGEVPSHFSVIHVEGACTRY